MNLLLEGLMAITAKQAAMYVVGGALIWLGV